MFPYLEPCMRNIFCYVACGLIISAAPCLAHAQEWTIAQWSALFAQTGAAKARFTEEKTIAALDRPVQSSGELSFTPPDVIEKTTLLPKPESMRLEGNTITLERGKKKYTLALDESPELAALTESIRATLAGDRHALEFHYTTALQGTRARWNMQLVPRHSKARQAIARITLSGTEAHIETIDIVQADGDRSTMQIMPLLP